MKFEEKPEAIIINMPEHFINAHGEDQVWKMFEEALRNDFGWHNVIANIPTVEVPWCYVSWLGKIRLRANIVKFELGATKYFQQNGRRYAVTGKNWIIITSPMLKAPHDIPRKGFQGFRYTKRLF